MKGAKAEWAGGEGVGERGWAGRQGVVGSSGGVAGREGVEVKQQWRGKGREGVRSEQ